MKTLVLSILCALCLVSCNPVIAPPDAPVNPDGSDAAIVAEASKPDIDAVVIDSPPPADASPVLDVLPPPPPDAGPPWTDAVEWPNLTTVWQACQVMGWFVCPEAHPDGGSCEDTVGKLIGLGSFPFKDAKCAAAARSVSAIRKCHIKCATK